MYLRLCLNWLRRLLRSRMNDPVPLNVGILIIGSLLWDGERRAWRDARLQLALAETATAPIRYGRLSGARRGHTYTMVFSRLCRAGQAKVVRCTHVVSSAGDLI